jgi:hypothetical protein
LVRLEEDYKLVFELTEKQLKHVHGPYKDQTDAGLIKDIEFRRSG